jgi:tripartite-type tricarboxylate transporter receptor subunit TctC
MDLPFDSECLELSKRTGEAAACRTSRLRGVVPGLRREGMARPCDNGGMIKRRQVLLSSIGAAAAAAAPAAWSQARPIRMIVPYAAGGPIDATARILAERVKDSLGPIIIDNRPGGGGNIGADAVAKAAPDGLTIGISAVATHAINPWLFAKMPYDPIKDFTAITQMVRVPNVLVVNAEAAARLKINSVRDLIAYARANPAKLNYGSGGNGSAGHLAGEMFKRDAGIYAVHIPYNGGNPAQLALLSGQVDFNFDNLATAAPNIRAGKLKALAVTTLTRSPSLPDVPPVADTLKGFAIDTWWGLVGPAGMPRDVVQKMNHAFVTALHSPEAKTRFASLLAEPVSSSPEEFAGFMRAELAKYEKVVKASGAKVD